MRNRNIKNRINKNKYYLLDTSYRNIFNLGFKYSHDYECYIYLFPIIYYNKIPTVWCRVRYYRLDNSLEYDIIKTSGELLAIYHDREFGNAQKYIKKIDNIIRKKFKTMGIIKYVNKKGMKRRKKNEYV